MTVQEIVKVMEYSEGSGSFKVLVSVVNDEGTIIIDSMDKEKLSKDVLNMEVQELEAKGTNHFLVEIK